MPFNAQGSFEREERLRALLTDEQRAWRQERDRLWALQRHGNGLLHRWRNDVRALLATFFAIVGAAGVLAARGTVVWIVGSVVVICTVPLVLGVRRLRRIRLLRRELSRIVAALAVLESIKRDRHWPFWV